MKSCAHGPKWLLLLVCLLTLRMAMLRRAECRVLQGDAVADEEASEEAENVHLTRNPARKERDVVKRTTM